MDRLVYIIKDLDMISQLEMGGLQLEQEEFNIVKTVQSVFDLLEMNAMKKHVTLTFDIEYEGGIIRDGR